MTIEDVKRILAEHGFRPEYIAETETIKTVIFYLIRGDPPVKYLCSVSFSGMLGILVRFEVKCKITSVLKEIISRLNSELRTGLEMSWNPENDFVVFSSRTNQIAEDMGSWFDKALETFKAGLASILEAVE